MVEAFFADRDLAPSTRRSRKLLILARSTLPAWQRQRPDPVQHVAEQPAVQMPFGRPQQVLFARQHLRLEAMQRRIAPQTRAFGPCGRAERNLSAIPAALTRLSA